MAVKLTKRENKADNDKGKKGRATKIVNQGNQ